MPTARTRANRKYTEKAYDRISLYIGKGMRETLHAHAAAQGLTLNAYINQLIENDLAEKGGK